METEKQDRVAKTKQTNVFSLLRSKYYNLLLLGVLTVVILLLAWAGGLLTALVDGIADEALSYAENRTLRNELLREFPEHHSEIKSLFSSPRSRKMTLNDIEQSLRTSCAKESDKIAGVFDRYRRFLAQFHGSMAPSIRWYFVICCLVCSFVSFFLTGCLFMGTALAISKKEDSRREESELSHLLAEDIKDISNLAHPNVFSLRRLHTHLMNSELTIACGEALLGSVQTKSLEQALVKGLWNDGLNRRVIWLIPSNRAETVLKFARRLLDSEADGRFFHLKVKEVSAFTFGFVHLQNLPSHFDFAFFFSTSEEESSRALLESVRLRDLSLGAPLPDRVKSKDKGKQRCLKELMKKGVFFLKDQPHQHLERSARVRKDSRPTRPPLGLALSGREIQDSPSLQQDYNRLVKALQVFGEKKMTTLGCDSLMSLLRNKCSSCCHMETWFKNCPGLIEVKGYRPGFRFNWGADYKADSKEFETVHTFEDIQCGGPFERHQLGTPE